MDTAVRSSRGKSLDVPRLRISVGTFILEEGDHRIATVRIVGAGTCFGMATFLGLSSD